jgi:hypothetical protein
VTQASTLTYHQLVERVIADGIASGALVSSLGIA